MWPGSPGRQGHGGGQNPTVCPVPVLGPSFFPDTPGSGQAGGVGLMNALCVVGGVSGSREAWLGDGGPWSLPSVARLDSRVQLLLPLSVNGANSGSL